MPNFNAPGLSTFFTGCEVRFWQAYTAEEAWSDELVTEYPVSTEIWLHGLTDMVEKMRPWLGPRAVRMPAAMTYSVNMLPAFEGTLAIDAFRLGMDKFGIYAPKMAQMAVQMKKAKDYNLRDLLFGLNFYSTADRQVGTDGLAHWSTVHPIDPFDAAKGTRANDFRSGGFAVNGVTVGGDLSTNALNTLYSEMSTRPSNNGEALGTIPDLAIGSTLLKARFATILKNQYMAIPSAFGLGAGLPGTPAGPFVGMQDNPVRDWVDHRVYADFAVSSATQYLWFMLVTKKAGIKPFSWGSYQKPVLIPRTAPTDPVVFDAHTFVYGSHFVEQPAWAPWFLSSVSGP